MSTALRLVGFLDVLSSTPAESYHAPCVHARLRRLATKLHDKCGLEVINLTNSAKDCFQFVAIREIAARFPIYRSDAISMTNRYFTSLLSRRSYASLICWILMSSISAVIPRSPQKSSISCVSRIPPIVEPARCRRFMSRLNAATADGFGGAPTSVMVPFSFSS